MPLHRPLHIERPVPPVTLTKKVSVAKFEHIPGTRVCRSLYPHVALPDGRELHVFHSGGLNTGEGADDPDAAAIGQVREPAGRLAQLSS